MPNETIGVYCPICEHLHPETIHADHWSIASGMSVEEWIRKRQKKENAPPAPSVDVTLPAIRCANCGHIFGFGYLVIGYLELKCNSCKQCNKFEDDKPPVIVPPRVVSAKPEDSCE